MSLEFLKSKKSDTELEIIEKDLDKLFPELKWELTLDDAGKFIEDEISKLTEDEQEEERKRRHPLRINHSKKDLKDHKLQVPVLNIDILLPFSYEHQMGRKMVSYKSYSNYVNYDIQYRKANLLKVVQQIGIKVLKRSEEKHLEPIVIDETPLYFRYDNEEEQWLEVKKPKNFEDEKEEIEEAIRSDEVRKIVKKYLEYQLLFEGEFEEYLEKEDYNGLVNYVYELKTITEDFHKLMNILCEINDEHYELIKNRIKRFENEDIVEAIKNLKDESIDIELKKSDYGTLKSKVTNILKNEGYWVRNNNIYPNIARFHSLKQKSETNRTPLYLVELHKVLIKYSQSNLKNYLSLEDPNVKNHINEKLK
jgi:hypothetical protein